MPAPHRRNVGQSLARTLDRIGRTNSIADSRDRLIANRERHAGKWEQVAADLDRARSGPVPETGPQKRARVEHESRRHEDSALARLEAFRTSHDLSDSRRPRDTVLAVNCPRHDALPGLHCWSHPRGLCGERIRRAGYARGRNR